MNLNLAVALRIPPYLLASGSTLLNGLISEWLLDEASGTRFDNVGSNDLTDNNTVGYANLGPSGTVASFVAANAEHLSTNALLDGMADVTIQLWVNPTLSGNNWILSQDDEGVNRCMTLYINAGGGMTWYLFDSVAGFVTASAPVNLTSGQWRFVSLVYDSATKKGTIWVDGVSGTPSAALANGLNVNAAIPFRLSADRYHLTMQQANAGVWGSVLDGTVIGSTYNAGRGKRYSDLTTAEKVGLVSYWNLDEASGTRADAHASNDLTDNNTVGSATAVGGAKDRRAAYFVAANSESLSRANASLVDWPQGDFHLAFWGYHTALAAEGNYVTKADSATNQREWRVGTAAGQTRAYLNASSDGITEDVATNTGDTSFPDNTWAAVEVRRSGTTIGVAINGGAFQDGTLSAVFNGTAVFRLGARNNTAATFLDGRMDAVALWGRVLTADERVEWLALDGAPIG